MDHVYDLVIIGGGINGCGCAADAASRGLSVLLCEQADLASKTSSNSSKLIHGGLRYLEHYDFNLVKKALDEQQILLQVAPYLVKPLSFVIPHEKKGRSNFLLRTGLFLYDHLSLKNTLPNSQYLKRTTAHIYFEPLIDELTDGFIYYDCATDDARLTLANALQAQKFGATIMTNTTLIDAKNHDNQWQLSLQPSTSPPITVQAKAVINAAGPWVASVNRLLQIPMQHSLSHVKGSHIIVTKLYEGEHAYVLQHDDKRIIFVIPYHGHTLIGTTELTFNQALDNVQIENSEIDYLCALVNQYFKKSINTHDIIHTFSGIRPLLSTQDKNPSALSRDYITHYSNQPAPAITIYGGKITTYRKLSLQVINQLQPLFPHLLPSISNKTPLPGSMLGDMDYMTYQTLARKHYHWLDPKTLERYFTTYGTLMDKILHHCNTPDDLGICFMPTLYQIEVDYLLREEWACTVDDIIWRRTKLGMSINEEQYKKLEAYCFLFNA